MALVTDNLSGYITRIRQWLHEITEDGSFWSDEYLKIQFNSNYRRRCTQLVMAFEGYFNQIATRDIVANQDRYAWPPGFERLIKLELVREDGRTVPIQSFERHEEVNFAPSSGGDNYLPTYRPTGGGFILEPAPTEDQTGALKMEFFSLPAELEFDNDTMHPDFPRTFSELVILDVVVAALDSENLLETGRTQTVLRLRQEYEFDWERYIDGRLVRINKITPFIPHYYDA